MEWINYHEYLNSWQWIEKKEYILGQRGRYCEVCGNSCFINVHHLTYATLGNERNKDLMVLCRRCHVIAHKLKLPHETARLKKFIKKVLEGGIY